MNLVLVILIPGMVFRGYEVDPEDQYSIETEKNLTFKLMTIEAVLGYFCFILNMLFMK